MFDPDVRISVEEALARTLERVDPVGVETVALEGALGRVLAADVVSDIDVNPFDNSSMDGYAVVASDLADASPASPVTLDVVGYIGAGSVYEQVLSSGQAVRLMTGAPVPAGADAVVKYEVVEVAQGDGGTGSRVTFTQPVRVGEAVRKAGEEFKAGEVALAAGTVVNAYALGMLASAGASQVAVWRRPVVGVFAIGSELVRMDERPTPGKIRDCNTWVLGALVREAGAELRTFGIVPDDREAISASLQQAVDTCDLVISAGGASQGDFDFIREVIEQRGELVFTYLSLRPGKRQTLGMVNGKPVFGLSGNPAACSVGFELLIRPALRKMQGFSHLERPRVKAELAVPVKKKEGRAFYQRGLVERAADGRWLAREYGTQSSALLGDLERCNCLIVVPEDNMGMAAGETVTCLRIDMPEETAL
jgi:molybdopterin molybdotransferase